MSPHTIIDSGLEQCVDTLCIVEFQLAFLYSSRELCSHKMVFGSFAQFLQWQKLQNVQQSAVTPEAPKTIATQFQFSGLSPCVQIFLLTFYTYYMLKTMTPRIVSNLILGKIVSKCKCIKNFLCPFMLLTCSTLYFRLLFLLFLLLLLVGPSKVSPYLSVQYIFVYFNWTIK